MKILIELPSWLGDTVMATPAIENLAGYYDNPEITLLGSDISVETLKNHPKVIKTLVFDKKYTSIFRMLKKLGKFDVFFSFRSSFRSRLLKLLISSIKKYQYINNDKFQDRHQVEKYNDFVNESLNTDFSAGRLNVVIGNLIESEKISVEKDNLTLGFNPGATYGDSKRWYPEEFVEVGAQLSNKYNIIIFGAPNEKEIAADIEKGLIEKGVTNYQNLAGSTSVEELIYHISTLDMFVTGDTGPMHLAAAFQVPTVAIFGPTKDNETSQWMNDKSTIVKKDLDCQPCMKHSCPLKHHNCMKHIKATEVLDAIKLLD